jgi:diguanylate cyclase (GGDEF)-like protein
MLITKAEQASITNSGMAVLNIDLDRFKQINDTLGHAAGDMMLKHAAKIMIESTEPDDFIARIGGDEFVILSSMRGGQERLSTLADTIIAKLRKPVLFEGHTCRMGGSIGIAMDDSAQIDARQLLLRSDIALYQAKSKGRNRFEFFSSQLQNEIINNKHIADEILVALEKREFIPYYQLQFHADSLDVAGVESLARWIHPQKGVLTPDRFLDIAGDLDVVSQIDKHILEQALADLASWRLKGVAIPKVSVNVSASRLDDPELADKIAAFDIEPGTLAFELLETIFLDETDDTVVQNLKMLKKMGIEIEIDDFGTGHASIVSLLKTAPNALKIDRQLIRPIVDVADQRKLVRSIIEIGKSLNLKVVAEGVETQEHARILRDLGCDLLQGYALARPMAFHEIETYVEAGSWRF